MENLTVEYIDSPVEDVRKMRKLDIRSDGKTITFTDQDDDGISVARVPVDDWLKSGKVAVQEYISAPNDPLHEDPKLDFYVIWFGWIDNGHAMWRSISVDKDGLSDVMNRLFNLLLGKQSQFAISDNF